MFTTRVEIQEASKKIDYNSQIMTLGSCFSENVGKKMQDAYFSVSKNPFGVLYNPESVLNSLYLLLEERQFAESDLFFHDSLWHSFSHSSLFSGDDAGETLEKMNRQLKSTASFFKKTNVLFITFGTAWVYKHIKREQTVSNCHKIPNKEFKRHRLSVEDIVLDYTRLIAKLNEKNPALQIIFTVSPIRHWKDGAHESNISKGILLLSIEALEKQFENVSYFPAYEILLDELRDYRYYGSDMLHPSEKAIDYIWERFSDTYFSQNTNLQKKELLQLRAALSHRPLHPKSESFRKFRLDTEKKKQLLIEKYPFLRQRLEEEEKIED